jgi:outer membrane protein/protease secretion system outer membrane protein
MKHYSLKSVSLAAALLAGSSTGWAMDLLQVYQAAQTQDATILASRAAATAGRERVPQAKSQLYPNISVSASRFHNNLISTAPNFLGQAQTTDSAYRSGNEALTIRQPIYRSGLVAQYFQAQAQVDEAEANLAQDEQSLAVRVTGAYFEALLTNEQLALVLSQREAFTTQLDAARKSFVAGSGTRTDVDDAQARLDMTYAQEIEARQNMDFTLRQLQSMVQEPVGTLVPLNVSKLELKEPQPNRLEDWVDKAERNNPQIKALQAQLEAATQEITKSKAGHMPTLDGIAQWTRSDSENVTNITSRYTNTSMGVQLTIPLFAAGYVSSQVRQSVANKERATQALEAGRRDLGIRVQKEFRGMTEGIPKIKAYEQALRSVDQSVLSSRKSFQAGSRTVLDVLNAEQQRMGVLRDLAQARYVYLISKIRLLALVGEAGPEAIAQMNSAFQAQ